MPTLKDVAALAGVSITTVSNVVNDSRRVSPKTRVRVEEAMARLGYRPHGAAPDGHPDEDHSTPAAAT